MSDITPTDQDIFDLNLPHNSGEESREPLAVALFRDCQVCQFNLSAIPSISAINKAYRSSHPVLQSRARLNPNPPSENSGIDDVSDGPIVDDNPVEPVRKRSETAC